MTTHEFAINSARQFPVESSGSEDSPAYTSASGSASHTPNSQSRGVMQATFGHPGGDVKPRLTKEQTDMLERNFQQCPKPSTQVKRTYADELRVPLDKVNNWFQNRRAKVKQDAKKAQSMGFGSIPNALIQDLGQLTSEQYIALLNNTALVQNAMENAQANGYRGDVHYSAPEAQAPVDQNMVLSSNDVPAFNGMPSFNPSSDAPVAGPMFGFSGTEQDQLSNSAMMDDASFSNESSGYAPSMETFRNADNMGPMNFQQTPMTFPTLDTSPAATAFGSGSDVSAADSGFGNWSSDKPTFLGVSPHDQSIDPFEIPHSLPRHTRIVSQPNDQFRLYTSMDPSGSPSSAHDAFGPGRQNIHQRTFSSPIISVSAAPDNEPTFPSGTPVSFSEEAAARRSSSTTELANSMDHIEIDSDQQSMDQYVKSNGASNLALRRQKRPVALGDPTALRSASYCAPLTSPNHTLAPNDHHLRRIKSTAGLPNGVASGRIQKPGVAQRSPVNFTFAEAGSSPKFAAQMSEFSVTSPDGAPLSASAAPPTPLTPQEIAPRFPPWQNQRAATFHAGMNSADAGYGESPPTLASPPSTPMYNNNVARSQLGSSYIPEDTPPQSAPATQQCFPSSQLAQAYSSSDEAMALYAFPDMPNMVQRRPSLPDTNQYAPVNGHVPFPVPVPMVDQDGQLRLNYPQYIQPQIQHQPHEFSAQQPAFLWRPASTSSAGSMPQHHKPQAELNVSMWQPPNPVSPEHQQPKILDKDKKSYTDFTFQNIGPENYEKQPSSSS
ncbi:MAG: hypothetical protein M1820_000511 [Bogoriella megaspora]|nr:MAG: hypothetical protein M1820_000511 [Bogoriella megaspora]